MRNPLYPDGCARGGTHRAPGGAAKLAILLGTLLLPAVAAAQEGRLPRAAVRAPAPSGGRFTRVEAEPMQAPPGAKVRVLGELRLGPPGEPRVAAPGAGAPKEIWFVLYHGRAAVARHRFEGPHPPGKQLRHTFQVEAPKATGEACFDLVASLTVYTTKRLDSRRVCLTVQPSRLAEGEAGAGIQAVVPIGEGQVPLAVHDERLTDPEITRLSGESRRKGREWHRAQAAKDRAELAAEQRKLDERRKVELAAAASELMTKLKTGPKLAHLEGKLATLPECLVPQITGFLVGSKVTPGGTIVIFGCGFTGNPEMRLNGNFPGGSVKVTPTFWEPEVFAGVIPAVSGTVAHQASLQVLTSHGASNHWNVEFTPAEEIRILKPGDVGVHCSNADISYDDCSDQPCDATLCAYHALWVLPAGAMGDDLVWINNLKNGWRYHDYSFSWTKTNAVILEDSFVGSSSSPKVKVHWALAPMSSASYRVKLKVIGPAGVPYK